MSATSRILLIATLVAATGAGAWYAWRTPAGSAKPVAADAAAAAAAARPAGSAGPGAAGNNAAAAPAPAEAAPAAKAPEAAPPPAPIPPPAASAIGPRTPAPTDLSLAYVKQAYDTSPDKRALFDELKAMGTPDSHYFAARLLWDCFDVGAKGYDKVIKAFMAKVPGGTANMAARIDAFRQLKEPCAGFDERPIQMEEIQQQNWTGLTKKDPRSIANALRTGQIELGNDDPFKVAASLLEKNDPYIITDVAGFMAGPAGGGMMIDGKPVDPAQHAAAVLAWELVACDYGGACGPTSPVLLGACADRGLCGLGSFEDLARVTTQNSNTYSQALEFRAQIRAALQNRDYVSLGLDPARRPKPKG